MNVAKINPSVKKVTQVSPFETKEEEAQYMVVSTNHYDMGGEMASFSVKFGILNKQAKANIDKFKVLLRTNVNLTKDEISDWGIDDTIIFEKIANKFNFNIVEITDENILNVI